MLDILELRVRFDSTPVLDISELHFQNESIYTVTGPNGAGKSTLLHCIAGLVQPASGSIRRKGMDIAGKGHADIGIVLQRPVLFAGTVRENIEYGLRCRGVEKATRARKTSEMMALLKIERLADRNRRELSGGEIQRVAVARTLALEPGMLLLDEPFTHIDEETSEILFNLLMSYRRNRCVIVTTHDLEKGYLLADDVLHIQHGKLTQPPIMNILKGESIVEDGKRYLRLKDGTLIQHGEAFSGTGAFQIDPGGVVISKSRLESSARNQFPGRLVSMKEEGTHILTEIDAGFLMRAHITGESMREMGLAVGGEIWISFKATALRRIRF